jgi:uncharacterized protein (DUF362 family)
MVLSLTGFREYVAFDRLPPPLRVGLGSWPDSSGCLGPSPDTAKAENGRPDGELRSRGGSMKKHSRRAFIERGARGALALGAASAIGGCEDTVLGSSDPSVPVETYATSGLAAPINAHVSAVKGDDLGEMTRQVIDAVGGMESVIEPGDTVFIKPNFVSFNLAQTRECFRSGECTKPEILIAVAEECLKAGAREVVIGDGSQKITYDWTPSYTLDGRTNLVEEASRLSRLYDGDVFLSCLEADYPGDYEIPSRTAHGTLFVSSIYEKANKIISVPVAKTHRASQLTLALKNFIGVLSIPRYGILVNNSYWDRGRGIDHSSVTVLAQAFLDVVAANKPDLAIIDFSIGVEGNGPTAGRGYGATVDVRDRLGSWLVLASKDIMAADATAARVMTHHVPDIRQLTMGFEMGLGEIREESIALIGERLADMRMEWRAAELANSLD